MTEPKADEIEALIEEANELPWDAKEQRIELLERAVSLAEEQDEPEVLAAGAHAAFLLGRHRQSGPEAKEAYARAIRLGMEAGTCEALELATKAALYRGIELTRNRRFEAAIETFHQGIEAARRAGSQRAMDHAAHCAGHVGMDLLELGRPDEAVDALEQAVEIEETSGARRGTLQHLLYRLGTAHVLGRRAATPYGVELSARAARAIADEAGREGRLRWLTSAFNLARVSGTPGGIELAIETGPVLRDELDDRGASDHSERAREQLDRVEELRGSPGGFP